MVNCMDNITEGVVIDYRTLTDDALQGLIESVVYQEGTDYGDVEFSLADKVAQVKEQLVAKEAVVVFDPQSNSANIIPCNSDLSNQPLYIHHK